MAQVNFRMDNTLKAQADAEFRRMGLTFSAAITLLCTQVVLRHKLPFDIESTGAVAKYPRASRESLESLGAQFLKHIAENPIEFPEDFKWSRGDANERKMKCLS